MKKLKRFVPNAIKKRIKDALDINQMFSLEELSDELAERKLAGILNSMNHKRFQDQVVVVTGGSGSIGRAISLRFAEEGAIVIVCGRQLDKLIAVVEEIEQKDGNASCCVFDITDSNSIDDAFEEITGRFHEIDVLINCAGGSARDGYIYTFERDISKIDEIISVNLRGAILCSIVAARQMKKQKYGKIINFSSLMGIRGKPGYSDYAAAKAGIIGFTKSFALELGSSNICVNCVTPSYVPRDVINDARIIQLLKSNCTNTIGTVFDIASTVLFLSSAEANFITGQNIIIDGGRSLGLMGD